MIRRSSSLRFIEPINLKQEILFMNPSFKPPMSDQYGLPTTNFFVSSIQSFNGKLWQLRTVRLRAQHFTAPFIINGGGICATQPILGRPFLQKIGAEHSNPLKQLAVETPIGSLQTFSEWDSERHSDTMTAADGILFNLIGHGLADLLQKIDGFAVAVLEGAITIEQAVSLIQKSAAVDVRNYLKTHTEALRRELAATLVAKNFEASTEGVALHEYAGKAGWLLPSPVQAV